MFFKPYVGEKYYDGFCGKRMLVVGASFYCNHTECPFYRNCTSVETKDSSAKEMTCSEYNREAGQKVRLSDAPSLEIDSGGRAYKRFGDLLSSHYFHGRLAWNEVWSMLSFTNYLQFVSPIWKTLASMLSERDLLAFHEAIQETSPDIVIVWGTVVNKSIRKEVVEILPGNDYLFYINHNGRRIAIVNPYHPSSPHFYLETSKAMFFKTLDSLLIR